MLTRQGKMVPCEDYHSLVKPDLVEVPGSPPGGETLGRTQFKDKKHTVVGESSVLPLGHDRDERQAHLLELTAAHAENQLAEARLLVSPEGGETLVKLNMEFESGTVSLKQGARGEQTQLPQGHWG